MFLGVKREIINEKIALIKSNARLLQSSTDKSFYENLESLLTVNQVETILKMPKEKQAAEFVKFLDERWQRIRGTALCYTLAPNHHVNKLCIDIAREIEPLPKSKIEINEMTEQKGLYFLLMTSLVKSTDIYGNNIHSLNLHQFILSDGEHTIIPLKKCLKQATISDDGVLRHLFEINGEYPKLSDNEIRRLQQHSTVVNQTYQAVLRFNLFRLHGDHLSAKLNRLASSIRLGGVHASGTEFNAAQASNVAILQFYEYWTELPQFEKDQVCKLYPELTEILGRLFRPKDAIYTDVSYCVELLADNLDTLVQRLNRDCLETPQRDLSESLERLKFFLAKEKDCYKADTRHLTSIPHVLPTIYRFPLEAQQLFLKDICRHNNLLSLILATNYNMLTEIKLRPEDKLHIQQLRLENDLLTPMSVWAAKNNQLLLVQYLINELGIDIDISDAEGNSALSWAAYGGHYELVDFLLSQNANKNIQGYQKNTPLLHAVLQKHTEVIQLLLVSGAKLDIRNVKDLNILDYAIEYIGDDSNDGEFENMLMDITLVKMVLLPEETQKECLKHYNIDTVLQFIISRRPKLLPHALAEFEVGCSYTFKMQQLMGLGDFGSSLHFALHCDSIESVKLLLNAGCDVNVQNLAGCTALHEAILSENRPIICGIFEYLAAHPEHYLDISILDYNNKTVLDYALAINTNDYTSPISGYVQSLAPMVQKKLIYQMYRDQPHFWNDFVIKKTLNSLHSLFNLDENHELKKVFEGVNYQKHLNNVLRLCKKYELSSDQNVVHAAKQLLLDLFRANNNLCFDNKDMPQKIEEFKQNCLEAIDTAQPVLKNHLEWFNVLAKFIMMLLTLPVSLPLYAMGFFSLQTHTNQSFNTLRQDLLQVVQP